MAPPRPRRRTPSRRSPTRRRPTRRPRGARSSRGSQSSGGSYAGLVVVLGLLIGIAAVNWLTQRPALLITLAVGLGLAGIAAAALYLAWRRARRRRRLTLTRQIAVADRLTGPEFEQWVGDLMRRTGFAEVQVSGGAGDLGADLTATAPDGRRVVVQCKRYAIDRRVGSPEVQRFAGTARALHGADIAAIITTATFTEPASSTAASLGIRLIGREPLARWAADGLLPVALAHHAAPEPVEQSWLREPPRSR